MSFSSLADGRAAFGAPSLFVRADVVVLAAGTLGSTEILLRSRAAGLRVSPRLGHAFSGNGNAVAFAYDTDQPVRAHGLGRRLPAPETVVGPCITGVLHAADGGGPERRREVLVEEGVLPAALPAAVPAVLAMAAEARRAGGAVPRIDRPLRSGGLLDARRMLFYLLMRDDGRDEGRLTLECGGLRIRLTRPPDLDRDEGLLQAATAALGAKLVTPCGPHAARGGLRQVRVPLGQRHLRMHASSRRLNDAMHALIDDLFGVGSLTALEQIARIGQQRAAVDANGSHVYSTNPERLRLGLLLLQGEHNAIFKPEGSLRTPQWLQAANGPSFYERVVLPGYAHLDALTGRDAGRDVYPIISGHLDRLNR